MYIPFNVLSPQITVVPGAVCASKSTMRVGGGSIATTGVHTNIIVYSKDEYGNSAGSEANKWVTRVISFKEWDALEPYDTPRSSRDCFNCGKTQTYTLQKNSNDLSFSGSFISTGVGAIKVLMSASSDGFCVGICVR